jgi:hypothetical protein
VLAGTDPATVRIESAGGASSTIWEDALRQIEGRFYPSPRVGQSRAPSGGGACRESDTGASATPLAMAINVAPLTDAQSDLPWLGGSIIGSLSQSTPSLMFREDWEAYNTVYVQRHSSLPPKKNKKNTKNNRALQRTLTLTATGHNCITCVDRIGLLHFPWVGNNRFLISVSLSPSRPSPMHRVRRGWLASYHTYSPGIHTHAVSFLAQFVSLKTETASWS